MPLSTTGYGQQLQNETGLGGFSNFADGVIVSPEVVSDPSTQAWLTRLRQYYPQANFVQNSDQGYQLSYGGAGNAATGTSDSSALPVNPATGSRGFGGAMDLMGVGNSGSNGDVRWNPHAMVNSPVYGPEVNRRYTQFDNNRLSQMLGPSIMGAGLAAVGVPWASGLFSGAENMGGGGSFNPMSILSMFGNMIPGYSQVSPYISAARSLYGLTQGGNPINAGLTLGRLMSGGIGG